MARPSASRDAIMRYGLEFRDVFAAWRMFLDGILVTLGVSVVAIVGGLILGILFASARIYGTAPLRRISVIYVEVVRNTPFLVQLFLIFFGLPSLGIKLSAITAAIIALVINLGAYTTEIVRAGLESVPRTQIEAGSALGLSRYQIFRYVVLFPALKAMTPALTSQFVFFILATAAISQISVPDLFYVGTFVETRTYRAFEVYILIAVLYLGLAFIFRGIFAAMYYLAFGRR